ncbi:hypothetical protein NAEGRDRAFT_56696 [Naegleria gruberi]|uniref:Elongator complex protein 4 n=1 Tax=Naegleria gruberi TaxID=5762 RepID=D2V071_NAEGR|nr:uncharacterized protein NAEGRDRAFT_56696 [Naegleria gruberi]EFC49477.1 hypothetical protein NAEGRDRAFT_56696 [Naegleria gruberi]|eukprot:XP_002682221.1 hypothetical protein NAEGRDRAFT_56696 [Naegleria gruberi strain NEG-M]
MKKTTFVRKGASLQRQLPTGTKPSVHNGQLLVSSGLHDLDSIIGGGFPLGSLVLIEEDRYSEYCQNLMRYFLSEGVTNRHSVVCGIFNQQQIAQQQASSSLLHPSLSSVFAFNYSRFKQEQELKEEEKEASTTAQTSATLPEKTEEQQPTKPASNSIMDRLNRKIGANAASNSSGGSTTQLSNSTSQSGNDSELKIAWRYQDFVEQQIKAKQQRGTSSSASSGEKSGVIGTVLCSEYDLSKNMQEELIKENLDGIHVLFDKDEIFESDKEEIKMFYDDILKKIANIITESKKHFASTATGNEISSRAVVRIGLQSLGSLFYNSGSNTHHHNYMLRFLLQLKSLLRSSLSVCVCTIPKVALQMMSSSLIQQLEQLSDLSMSIDSFTGSQLDVSDWEFKEYSGLFYIKKLFKMNSLTYNFTPDTLNYAFKIKKRKMYIEKLHLPPEETREASNPDRPKFKASNDVERHKLKVNKVLKEVPSVNQQNDQSLQQADDHVFGCASQSSVTGSNPLDF